MKRDLLIDIHHFDSDVINNMDHCGGSDTVDDVGSAFDLVMKIPWDEAMF